MSPIATEIARPIKEWVVIEKHAEKAKIHTIFVCSFIISGEENLHAYLIEKYKEVSNTDTFEVREVTW